MCRRKTVVLTTWSSDEPAASNRPRRLTIACSSSATTPPETILPSTCPIWPEATSQSPARTRGVYGPTGVLMGLLRADTVAGRVVRPSGYLGRRAHEVVSGRPVGHAGGCPCARHTAAAT